MRKILIQACLLVSFILTFPSLGSTAGELLEYQLAIINAGRYVSKNHSSVARFRNLLNQLSGKYAESKQQIADMTVKAVNLMKKGGIEENPLRIMEGLSQLFYSRLNLKYTEFAAAYVTLRNSGKSHRNAVEGLRQILQATGSR